MGSALFALGAILIGRVVFGSLSGFFFSELILGAIAGGKYRLLSLPGGVMGCLAYLVFLFVQNSWPVGTESSMFFLILFAGTLVFIVSGSVALLLMKKFDAS